MSVNNERHAQAPYQHNADTPQSVETPDDISKLPHLNPNTRNASPQDRFTQEEIDRASGIPGQHPGYNKLIAGMVLGGIGTVAIAGAGIFGYKKFTEDSDQILSRFNNMPVAEAPYIPGDASEAYSMDDLDRMDLYTLLNSDRITPAIRMDYAMTHLEDKRAGTVQRLRERGYNPILPNEVSDNNTPEEIMWLHEVDKQTIYAEENPEKAKKMLAGILDPSSNDYSRLSSLVGNGGTDVAPFARLLDASVAFSNDYDLIPMKSNGQLARILTVQTIYEDQSVGRVNQMAIQYIAGQEREGWLAKEIISSDDPRTDPLLRTLGVIDNVN